MFELTVIETFSLDGVDHPRGTEITDQTIVARVLTEFPSHVVKRAVIASTGPTPEPEEEPHDDEHAE